MPVFRSAPSSSLTDAVRRLVASGGRNLSPMQEIQADQMAAQTSQYTSLAQKARLEAEQMQREGVAAQEAERLAPQRRTEFAAHSAGINLPEATQLSRHIRGELDSNPQGAEDATGNVYGDVPVTRPENLPAGSERLFRSALAAAQANMLGGGKTNAEQLTSAAGNVQKQNIVQMVQDAIARGDVQGASAMSQGAQPGTAIKLHENIGTTGATFSPSTGDVRADPSADPTNRLLPATLASEAAQAEQRRAAAVASRAAATKTDKPEDRFKDVTTLRKEFNDNAEVKSYRNILPIVESARSSPDTRAGDIQMAYAVGKILDPNSVVREGELKLVGDAATLPEKMQGEMRTLVMGKGRMTPTTRAEIVAMLDNAVDNRERAYLAAETSYRRIAEQNGFQLDQIIIDAPRRKRPGLPAGEVEARKKIGAVEFVKIGGKWFQP